MFPSTLGGNMKRFIQLLTLIALPLCLTAEIYEIQSIEELYDFLPDDPDPDLLIIFDIDNTLIEPVQELGTDQWFYSRLKDHLHNGHDGRAALDKAIREWTAVLNISKMKLVESAAEVIVRDLQKSGYHVMGMTTRGLGMATLTIEQLQHLGIDLSLHAPHEEDFLMRNEGTILYRKGILFTSGTHKGEALHRFFDTIDYPAMDVMFINDKLNHLTPVEEMCLREEIGFYGLRYGKTDERVKNFNRDIADVQFKHFGKILSDDEAKELLSNSSSLRIPT